MMDAEQYQFLEALERVGPTFRRGLPCGTEEQNQARQKLRKAGLARYGKKGWALEDAGRAALAEHRRGK
jgi:hypothetical protein